MRLIDKIQTLEKEGLRHNSPQHIVIHSTFSYQRFDDLLKYHKEKRGWEGIGYHVFMDHRGRAYQARPFDLEGAHALGFNTSSIGICFYSDDGHLKFPKRSKRLIKDIKKEFPDTDIIPHTYAQAVYNNRLLEENGYDFRFPEYKDISKDFDYISDLVMAREIDDHDIETELKKFKNCPGRLFYELVEDD